MTISKDIKFDCAHMLSNYDGKCSNLHGHTYHGTVTLEGDVNPQTGMLIDYNRIKQIVDEFDHATVFSEEAIRNNGEQELYQWAKRYNMRMVELHGKSTAENIATTLALMFVVEPGVDAVHIRLSETDGSWAIAEASK